MNICKKRNKSELRGCFSASNSKKEVVLFTRIISKLVEYNFIMGIIVKNTNVFQITNNNLKIFIDFICSLKILIYKISFLKMF